MNSNDYDQRRRDDDAAYQRQKEADDAAYQRRKEDDDAACLRRMEEEKRVEDMLYRQKREDEARKNDQFRQIR